MKLLKNNSKFLKKPSVSLLIGPYIMKNFITTALLLSSGVFIAGQTNASTAANTTFQVKIEVVSTCSINTTDIDFGKVDSDKVGGGDKRGTLNVTCTSQTPYKVGLSGSGKMTNKDDPTSAGIDYKLFQGSSDKAWDNKDNLYSATGSGDVQNIPVVAKLFGSTNVRAGNYADTVTATVTY